MNEAQTVISLWQQKNFCHQSKINGKSVQAIRKMEPAWRKVQGGKFSLLQKIYENAHP